MGISTNENSKGQRWGAIPFYHEIQFSELSDY